MVALVSDSRPNPNDPIRRIKRYDNRKLYLPAERRYLTVADVRDMVVAGDEVQVEDQRSGEDLTSQVLAQALLDQLRDKTAHIPRQVLVALLRIGAGRSALADWPDPQATAARLRHEAERIATGLLSRGRLTIDEALSLRQDIARALHGVGDEAQRAVESRVQALLGRGADAPGPRQPPRRASKRAARTRPR
jgi:polyhydroxyalkanoate synthesis repressor PhaR